MFIPFFDETRLANLLTLDAMDNISKEPDYKKAAVEVAKAGGDYLAFLHTLLEEEVSDRRARRIQRRIKEARFPQIKRLSELDPKELPKGLDAVAHSIAGIWRRRSLSLDALRREAEAIQDLSASWRDRKDGDLAAAMRELALVFARRSTEALASEHHALGMVVEAELIYLLIFV